MYQAPDHYDDDRLAPKPKLLIMATVSFLITLGSIGWFVIHPTHPATAAITLLGLLIVDIVVLALCIPDPD